ncbi:MAG: M20/M25/M40 family metallo-hydrolase, partial [Candidatus Dormiibacterota bacterium]
MAAPTTQSPADLLAELIRFDTTNPPGAEGPCLELIRGRFRERGIEGQLLAGDAARPNLVVRVPGRGQAPPLLLQGHVDVVTTVGQRWSRPPFAGEVADGEVWGRGALDMKGGVAMMVTALLRGLDEGRRPAGDVVLAGVADEEAGGRQGAQYLAERHRELFDGVRHGIGEGGGVRQNLAGTAFYPIMAAEKRACRLRMTFRGPGGHASRVHRGGTMAALGRALTALDEARLPVAVNPIVARLVETIAAHVAEPARSTFLALRDPARAESALAALGEAGETLNPILH